MSDVPISSWFFLSNSSSWNTLCWFDFQVHSFSFQIPEWKLAFWDTQIDCFGSEKYRQTEGTERAGCQCWDQHPEECHLSESLLWNRSPLLCICTCEREQQCSWSKVAEKHIIHIDLGCSPTPSFAGVLVDMSIHGQLPWILAWCFP